MRRFISVLLLMAGLAVQPFAHAEEDNIVVVANTPNMNLQLSRQQIRNLFMGVSSTANLFAVSLSPEHRARTLFNTKVLGLTESRIQSYWAQMRFSGRGKAPQEFSEVALLLAHIESQPGAIAYLPAGVELPAHLVVVYSTAQL